MNGAQRAWRVTEDGFGGGEKLFVESFSGAEAGVDDLGLRTALADEAAGDFLDADGAAEVRNEDGAGKPLGQGEEQERCC